MRVGLLEAQPSQARRKRISLDLPEKGNNHFMPRAKTLLVLLVVGWVLFVLVHPAVDLPDSTSPANRKLLAAIGVLASGSLLAVSLLPSLNSAAILEPIAEIRDCLPLLTIPIRC